MAMAHESGLFLLEYVRERIQNDPNDVDITAQKIMKNTFHP